VGKARLDLPMAASGAFGETARHGDRAPGRHDVLAAWTLEDFDNAPLSGLIGSPLPA